MLNALLTAQYTDGELRAGRIVAQVIRALAVALACWLIFVFGRG